MKRSSQPTVSQNAKSTLAGQKRKTTHDVQDARETKPKKINTGPADRTARASWLSAGRLPPGVQQTNDTPTRDWLVDKYKNLVAAIKVPTAVSLDAILCVLQSPMKAPIELTLPHWVPDMWSDLALYEGNSHTNDLLSNLLSSGSSESKHMPDWDFAGSTVLYDACSLPSGRSEADSVKLLQFLLGQPDRWSWDRIGNHPSYRASPILRLLEPRDNYSTLSINQSNVVLSLWDLLFKDVLAPGSGDQVHDSQTATRLTDRFLQEAAKNVGRLGCPRVLDRFLNLVTTLRGLDHVDGATFLLTGTRPAPSPSLSAAGSYEEAEQELVHLRARQESKERPDILEAVQEANELFRQPGVDVLAECLTGALCGALERFRAPLTDAILTRFHRVLRPRLGPLGTPVIRLSTLRGSDTAPATALRTAVMSAMIYLSRDVVQDLDDTYGVISKYESAYYGASYYFGLGTAFESALPKHAHLRLKSAYSDVNCWIHAAKFTDVSDVGNIMVPSPAVQPASASETKTKTKTLVHQSTTTAANPKNSIPAVFYTSAADGATLTSLYNANLGLLYPLLSAKRLNALVFSLDAIQPSTHASRQKLLATSQKVFRELVDATGILVPFVPPTAYVLHHMAFPHKSVAECEKAVTQFVSQRKALPDDIFAIIASYCIGFPHDLRDNGDFVDLTDDGKLALA
jgi:hypothetical protein